MYDRARSRVGGAGGAAPTRRSALPEHPLLALQRAAGNAAVSRLVADLAVQRWTPPDDDEEGPEGPADGPDEGEGVPKNPEKFPNAPPEAPDEALPDPEVPVQWMGVVDRGGIRVFSVPLKPGAMVESSRAVVAEYASSLPYEALPPEFTGGGGEPLLADARKILTNLTWVVSRQLFRAWAGLPSPDIDRIVNGPGGPGGGPAPGGGRVPGGAPGGIPGMEPVPPGGSSGPGGIPGMEPVTPGGPVQTPGGIPGMEPVPGPSGPGMEPVPPGGGEGPTASRPMLRLGSVGDAVRQAQELLVQHGASLDPDGQFGQLTRRAVIDFQRASGLDPDGIVGKRTWSALESP